MTFLTLNMASNDLRFEKMGLRPGTQNYWQKWPNPLLKTQVDRKGVSEGPNPIKNLIKGHQILFFSSVNFANKYWVNWPLGQLTQYLLAKLTLPIP